MISSLILLSLFSVHTNRPAPIILNYAVRQGKKTILTIDIHNDKYTFLIIIGKAEREKFDQERQNFTKYFPDYYDNARTYHDGKWMFIDITSLDVLDDIKRSIIIKKKPNRKPFPKENAVYGKCGHKCDLCVHFLGGAISDEFRRVCLVEQERTQVDPVLYFSASCPR